MKAVRVHQPGQYSIDEVPMPVAGPKDVVVKMRACGICGSDIHFVQRGSLRPDGSPMPLGHEATGVVESVGSAVTNIPVGSRVFINPMATNGAIIGTGADEGAFASHILIRNAVMGESILAVPADLSMERAALAEPLAVGLHTVNRGNPTPDSKVAVFGCGPIGLAAIIWLVRRGVRHIVAIDVAEERLEHARRMGVHATVNPSKEDLAQRLREEHGAGAPVMGQPTVGTDIFYDLAAGKGLIDQITAMAKFRSRLVIGAIYIQPVEVNFRGLIMREMEITTAGVYQQELRDALNELPAFDPAVLDAYVTSTFPFDDFDTAFAVAKQVTSAKVMLTFA
ncbi:hypothetical protein A7X12_14135 [Sphingomonas sp. TDK1]|nr:hypothetical protein A7X12_14135 [Sphingomonas sp. TDK1]